MFVKENPDRKKKKGEVLKALKPEKKNQEVESMEGIFPKNIKTDEIKNKIDEIRKLEYKT